MSLSSLSCLIAVQSGAPRGLVDLNDIAKVERVDSTNKPYCILVETKNSRRFCINLNSDSEVYDWMDDIYSRSPLRQGDPTNFVHHQHATFDPNSGKFVVRTRSPIAVHCLTRTLGSAQRMGLGPQRRRRRATALTHARTQHAYAHALAPARVLLFDPVPLGRAAFTCRLYIDPPCARVFFLGLSVCMSQPTLCIVPPYNRSLYHPPAVYYMPQLFIVRARSPRAARKVRLPETSLAPGLRCRGSRRHWQAPRGRPLRISIDAQQRHNTTPFACETPQVVGMNLPPRRQWRTVSTDG